MHLMAARSVIILLILISIGALSAALAIERLTVKVDSIDLAPHLIELIDNEIGQSIDNDSMQSLIENLTWKVEFNNIEFNDVELNIVEDGGESLTSSSKLVFTAELPLNQNLRLTSLSVECSKLAVTYGLVDCKESTLEFSINHQLIEWQGNWQYHLAQNRIAFNLQGLKAADGLSISGKFDSRGLNLDYKFQSNNISHYINLLSYFNSKASNLLRFSSGRIKGEGSVRWTSRNGLSGLHQGNLRNFTGGINSATTSLTNESLQLVDIESFNSDYEINITRNNNQDNNPRLNVKSSLSNISGTVLAGEQLLEFDGREFISVNATINDGDDNVTIKQLIFKHPSVSIDFLGNYTLSLPTISGELSVKINDWSYVLNNYLLGYVLEYELEDLTLKGISSYDLSLVHNRVTKLDAMMELSEASNDKYGVEDLSLLIGLNLSNDSQSNLSENLNHNGHINLGWSSARYEKLPIGGTNAKFTLQDQQLVSRDTITIPLLDGQIAIESLQAIYVDTSKWLSTSASINSDSESAQISFASIVSPISLSRLSDTLDLPPMEGALSAVIPEISASKEQIGIDGALLIRVFDGQVVIKDLIVDEPFTDYSSLSSNMDFSQLDLNKLTQTFDFGQIQGSLNGWVNGLKLYNWEPHAFSACLQTPNRDPLPHRISQKAIDNLSSLGGASGALSRTFLRFFENFSYDKMGLCCRLEDGVCQMSGVSHHPSGFYIVEGGGIPRIDIIGYQRQVDWDVLMSRLQRIRSDNRILIE